MKYKSYLKNKNLSKETIRIYTIYAKKWIEYLNDRNPTKTLFVKYIKKLSRTHKANSIKLQYACILSYLKFEKKWKLYQSFQDIKLPEKLSVIREVISLDEFNKVKNSLPFSTWHQKRNTLIFCTLFMTGIRVNELKFVKIRSIKDNKIEIKCKGNTWRNVYIPDNLLELYASWRRNQICVSKKGKIISNTQIIKIIHNIGRDYFDKSITPHSLRRSYATNLLRLNVDLKTVSKMMGHKNISTTSKYIFLTEEEMFDKVKNVFKSI